MRAEGQGDRGKGRKPGQHGAAGEALGRAGSCGRVWGHTGGQARGPEIAVAPEGVGDGQRWTLERPSLSVQPLPFRPPRSLPRTCPPGYGHCSPRPPQHASPLPGPRTAPPGHSQTPDWPDTSRHVRPCRSPGPWMGGGELATWAVRTRWRTVGDQGGGAFKHARRHGIAASSQGSSGFRRPAQWADMWLAGGRGCVFVSQRRGGGRKQRGRGRPSWLRPTRPWGPHSLTSPSGGDTVTRKGAPGRRGSSAIVRAPSTPGAAGGPHRTGSRTFGSSASPAPPTTISMATCSPQQSWGGF